MWTALHPPKGSIAKQVQDILKSFEGLKEIVLCGHSLGGAYAILCGLELLQMGVNIHAIVAHGAPQVIEPDFDCDLWHRLEKITTVYINGYDVVPRLPSCHDDWKHTINESFRDPMGSVSGSVSQNMVKVLKRTGAFRHVGKLMFITVDKTGNVKCMRLAANGKHGDAGWKKLKERPKWSGYFILKHHDMYQDVLEAWVKQTL
jgi:pimeloyl-ACP methyl ester carboxylesterase